MSSDEELSDLLEEVSSEDTEKRKEARKEIVEIGEKATDPLIDKLDEEEKRDRLEAARLLGRIGDPKAVEPLVESLDDPEKIVRKRAVKSLIDIGRESIDSLLDVLDSQDELVVKGAVQALGEIGEPEIVEEIIPL